MKWLCARHSLKFCHVGVAGAGSVTDAELSKHTYGGTAWEWGLSSLAWPLTLWNFTEFENLGPVSATHVYHTLQVILCALRFKSHQVAFSKSPQVSGKSEIGTREDRACQWVTGSIKSVSHTASQTKHSFWSLQDVGWGRTWWLWLGKPKRGLGKWTSESKL